MKTSWMSITIVLLGLAAGPVSAQRLSLASDAHFPAQSSAGHQVLAWLLARHRQTDAWTPDGVRGKWTDGTTVSLGTARISSGSTGGGKARADLAETLPATGSPGERVAISINDSGKGSTGWTYVWGHEGSDAWGWVLTDYEDHRPVELGGLGHG